MFINMQMDKQQWYNWKSLKNKKNAFESVLMRWMKLEPIIQSEVSQKEKHQYSISSVQFRSSVVSDSLQPHGLQNARSPCPSPTPGVYPNSCPLSRWCHPAISSSVVPFSSCLQSFPASGSFPMSQFFPSWPKYWSFSFSISPPNEYSGLISFRMDWFDLLAAQGTLKSLL